MNRYQKFGLCVGLIIGLLVLMWFFANGFSRPEVSESRHLSPSHSEVESKKVESHSPNESY